MASRIKFSSMRFGRSVRWRLTLWYTLVLSLSFVFFAEVVDRLAKQSLYSQVDGELTDARAMVTGALDRAYKEEGNPAPARLRDEIDELGLPSHVALQLQPAEGPAYFFNVRFLPEPVLSAGLIASSAPISVDDGARSWRLCRGNGGGKPGYQVLLALDLTLVDAQLRTLRRTLLIVLPLIVLFAAGSGLFLAGRALQPVTQIAAQARHIEAHALEQRLEVASSQDEFGQLAQVLNDLFARLERAFQQQRQFLSDAAHELRTPAAILRSQADVALEKPRTAVEYAATLAAMRSETEHLSAIVDDLLLIARAEASQLPVVREPADLVEITDESCRAMRPIAQSKSLLLNWSVGDEVNVPGDARLLRRALVNLLANAVKYTPAGGVISVRVKLDSAFASVVVKDTGKGIAADDLAHIFDRFYRGSGRSGAESEGAGLGLAIVKMIAELHRGHVTVASDPGRGSTFALYIPRGDG
jgi:heavy metal sensor kinase